MAKTARNAVRVFWDRLTAECSVGDVLLLASGNYEYLSRAVRHTVEPPAYTPTCGRDPREDPALAVFDWSSFFTVILLENVHAAAPCRRRRPTQIVPRPVSLQNSEVIRGIDLEHRDEKVSLNSISMPGVKSSKG